MSFSRGIFPTQGSNLGLLHCRQMLYRLSYKGSLLYPNGELMRPFHIQTWDKVKQTRPWLEEHKHARRCYCVTGSRVPVEEHRPLVVVDGTVGRAKSLRMSHQPRKFRGATLPPRGG